MITSLEFSPSFPDLTLGDPLHVDAEVLRMQVVDHLPQALVTGDPHDAASAAW